MLRVSDTVDGIFLHMPEILAPLSPDAHALQWRMLALGDVTFQEGWDFNLPFIERTLVESENGLELSFSELEQFAGRITQVIDGLFVAADISPPRATDSDDAILSRADMTVAAVDSSYWLVSARGDVLTRVERSFSRVTEEDPPFLWRGD
jgi:hypothetical protein